MVIQNQKQGLTRHKYVVLRVSSEEREKLKENALNLGMTVSDFIRKQTLDITVPTRGKKSNLDHQILGQLLGQIGRVGNNINQLTRSVNAGILPHLSKLDEAIETWCLLEKAILQILNPQHDISSFAKELESTV